MRMDREEEQVQRKDGLCEERDEKYGISDSVTAIKTEWKKKTCYFDPK